MLKYHVKFFYSSGEFFSHPIYAPSRLVADDFAASLVSIYNSFNLFPIVSFSVRKGRSVHDVY